MKKRQANFELLRIIAMYMVVIQHYLNHYAGSMFFDLKASGLTITAVVLDSFCIVAVNAYVLLSGYFLSERPFSLRRLVCLILQVLFYTILIPVLLAFLGAISFSEILDPYHVWNSLFPVQSGHYWFVSAYVVMALFSPFLNAALDKLEKKQLELALAGLLVFFCAGKSLSPLQFATDRYGYDFGWFLVLYLLGGYLRKFGLPFMKSAARGWAVYLGSAGLIAALELLLLWAGKHFEGLRYYASVPFHYNFLLCLTGALGLFYGFSHMRTQRERLADAIRWLSPAVFGVYLIHEQADVSSRWYGWLNALTAPLGLDAAAVTAGKEDPFRVLWFLAALLVQVTILFVCCAAVDKLRGLLFARIQKRMRKQERSV